MHIAAKKFSVPFILLLLVGLWCFGCGTGDLLDENNQRYMTDVSFSDGDNDGTMTVDIVIDGNETFTDLFADITIAVAEEVPGITMTGYKISFDPITSVDTSGNIIVPPDMPTPYTGTYDVDIPTNSSVEFRITCMEADMKLYMGSFITVADLEFRYEVTIRMDFLDEYDQPRDLTIRRTLYFGWYANT